MRCCANLFLTPFIKFDLLQFGNISLSNHQQILKIATKKRMYKGAQETVKWASFQLQSSFWKQVKYVRTFFYLWFLKIWYSLKIWYFFIIEDIGSEDDNMSITALKLLLFFGHRDIFFTSLPVKTFKIVNLKENQNFRTSKPGL